MYDAMTSKKSHTLLPFAQPRRRPTSTMTTLHATRPAIEQIEAYRQLSRTSRIDAGQRVKLDQLRIEILYLLHEQRNPVLPSHALLPTLAVRMSTMCEAMRSLHKKGLISYIPDRTDKRCKRVQISTLGRQRVRQFFRYFELLMQHRPMPRL